MGDYMKKKIIIAITTVLTCLVLFLINVLVSNYFLKDYYTNDGVSIKLPRYSYGFIKTTNDLSYPRECCNTNIIFKSLRSKTYLDDFIRNYIEYLPSCYDESYFYDTKYNVTYSKYTVLNKGLYNELSVSFQKGNACLNVYTLDDKWIDIVNDSKITESTFNYKLLLSTLEQSSRLSFNERIVFDETNKYQVSGIYQKYGYTLYFNAYSSNVIGVTRIDAGETSKYALYDIGKSAEDFLKSL